MDDSKTPGDAPYTPTLIWWYNDARGAKIGCVYGKYEDIPYGSVQDKQFHAAGSPPHPVNGQYQRGFACSPTSLTIFLDGDYADKWELTATGRYLGPWRNVATVIRDCGDGTFKFHVIIIVPRHLAHLWPKQRPALFGHIKSNGLCYAEGIHATGTLYQGTGKPWRVADEELMRCFLTDNGGHLHTEASTVDAADFDTDSATWTDPDGAYPEGYAGKVLGNWVENTRNDSLVARCGIIKAAGENGRQGMATLFGELCSEYSIDTGRGDADVYRAYARCYPAYGKVNQIAQDTMLGPEISAAVEARAARMAARAAEFAPSLPVPPPSANGQAPPLWSPALEARYPGGVDGIYAGWLMSDQLWLNPDLEYLRPYLEQRTAAEAPAPVEAASPEDLLAELAARYTPVDWEAAWKDQPEEVSWLYRHWLEAGTINTLYAWRGTGKSLLAQEAAWALACDGHSVVYIDEENRVTDWVERLQAIGAELGDLANLKLYSFAALPPLDTPEGGWHLLALAVANRAELVVIDTTMRTVQGGENDSDTFNRLYRCTLAGLKARGITVLRLDQLGKDASRGQRGSSAKGDAEDTVWELKTITPEISYRLERTKTRSDHGPPAYTLTRQKNPLRHAWTLNELNGVTQLAAEMDKLGVAPGAGRAAIRAAVRGAGIKASNSLIAQAIRYRRAVPDPADRTISGAVPDLGDRSGPLPDSGEKPQVKQGESGPGPLGDRSAAVQGACGPPAPHYGAGPRTAPDRDHGHSPAGQPGYPPEMPPAAAALVCHLQYLPCPHDPPHERTG